jgi:membrane protease YdiL (CAAX protease family)
MAKMSRDLLIFFAFTVFPIAGFSLMKYPFTDFYLPMFALGLVVLFGLRHYYQEPDQLVDYDENLDFTSLLYIGAGALGMCVLGGILYRSFSQSMLFIPMNKLSFTFGQLSLNGFVSDVLFTIVCVATAEEVLKLDVHLASYIWLKEHFGIGMAKIVSTGVPIVTWAVLHAYQNADLYGSNLTLAISSIALCGVIIFMVMKWRKSLLAAILVHALYNILILYMKTYG